MNNKYTAIIEQSGEWWIGWIEEVLGENCQEKKFKEFLNTLKITLKEALEFNRLNAINAAGIGFKEATITM